MNEVSSLRRIPSVDKVLRELSPVDDLPRPAVLAVVRRELAAVRAEQRAAGQAPPPPPAEEDRPEADRETAGASVVPRIRRVLDDLRRSRIQPVINGSGILIHTNLGRSPLAPAAVESLTRVAESYNNLEYDLSAGERGGRAGYLEHNLALLCEAEAATVVNNCAAALVLILRHFTATPPRDQVLISRGELVQIGGGFRIPEVLEASGATLRELGTTNKTTLDDYRRVLSDRAALVLKVHRSNFYMGGFVASPPTREIAALAHEHGVPFVEDLGSGATFATETLGGGEHEPTPAEVLGAGVDLTCFSGDKLLGGPQAGIIAGRRKHIAALKRNPFFRALRCDKLILAALQATVDLHLSGASERIPLMSMMRMPTDELRRRAHWLADHLADLSVEASVGEGRAQVGGGSLPRTVIPSITLDLSARAMSPQKLAAELRAGSPPVIGYISGGRLKLDLRTIFPRQDERVLAALRRVIVERKR